MSRTNTIPYEGIKLASEIHTQSSLKQIDIKVGEIEVRVLDKFPWFIEEEDATKDNPIGILDYKMRVYRTKHCRVVTASNIFYLKDPADRPLRITLAVKVGSNMAFTNKHDNAMFDIAYGYSKAVLDSSDYSCPAPSGEDMSFKVNFHLPDSYNDITESNTKHYDGYETLKVVERNEN